MAVEVGVDEKFNALIEIAANPEFGDLRFVRVISEFKTMGMNPLNVLEGLSALGALNRHFGTAPELLVAFEQSGADPDQILMAKTFIQEHPLDGLGGLEVGARWHDASLLLLMEAAAEGNEKAFDHLRNALIERIENQPYEGIVMQLLGRLEQMAAQGTDIASSAARILREIREEFPYAVILNG